ncbi:hypothetical protein AURDEDRAFT_115569 [Auricularia subglabra TFB-10046 SS5]|nr:hypothetical protein AURDEDRAFT_115569 [Auricularia subglabra TFB-10046 SS5]
MSSAEYELIYWPGLPGRGEPIRLLFEEAGTPYRDTAKEKDGMDKVVKAISPDFAPPAGSPKFLAPPALRVGDLLISQSPNIMLYLGEKLPGLVPKGDPDAKYKVNQLVLTALDLQNEAHDTHHPIASGLYYEDQKPEAKRRAADFRDVRIPKFLSYFDRVIEQTGGPYLLSEFSYADLVLWHVVDGLRYAFPKATERQLAKSTRVKALYDAVSARERIAAYLKSDRRAKYGDGIYRYYAELDE